MFIRKAFTAHHKSGESFENVFTSYNLFLSFSPLSVARTSQKFFIPPISVSLMLNLLLYVVSYFGFQKLQKIKITTFLTLQLKKCAKENKLSASNIAHMEKVETMWVILFLLTSALRSLMFFLCDTEISFEKLLTYMWVKAFKARACEKGSKNTGHRTKRLSLY